MVSGGVSNPHHGSATYLSTSASSRLSHSYPVRCSRPALNASSPRDLGLSPCSSRQARPGGRPPTTPLRRTALVFKNRRLRGRRNPSSARSGTTETWMFVGQERTELHHVCDQAIPTPAPKSPRLSRPVCPVAAVISHICQEARSVEGPRPAGRNAACSASPCAICTTPLIGSAAGSH